MKDGMLYKPSHERVARFGKQRNGMAWLRNQAEDIASHSEDILVTPSMLRFHLGEDGKLLGDCNGKQFWFSDHAFRQLCARCDVPAAHIIRCLQAGDTDLAEQNIRAWHKGKDRQYLVRVTSGRIRGILTQRYSVMDSHRVLQAMSDVIRNNYRLTNYLLNDSRLHARFVMPGTIRVPGEDLEFGIQLDSSDVGRQTLQVRYFLFKQVCSNGLVATRYGGVLFRHRHVGIEPDAFRVELQRGLLRIPQINENVTESIKRAIDTDYIVDGLEHALQHDPMIQKFKKEAEVTNAFLQDVVTRHQERYQKNLWGFVNAVTDVCQSQAVEQRLAIERFASYLLFSLRCAT